jgi:hypothetical protein
MKRHQMREIPAEWRGEILSAARRNADGLHASPAPLSTINSLLSTLFWPSPRAWAGVAAIWVAIFAVNVSVGGNSQIMAKHITPPTPALMLALQQPEPSLAEPTFPPREPPAAERARPELLRPRSERQNEQLLSFRGVWSPGFSRPGAPVRGGSKHFRTLDEATSNRLKPGLHTLCELFPDERRG